MIPNRKAGWFAKARVAWAKKNVTDFMVTGDKRDFMFVFANNGKLYCTGGFGSVDRRMGFARSFVRWWKTALITGYAMNYETKDGMSHSPFSDRVQDKWAASELADGFDPAGGGHIGKPGTPKRIAWDAGLYDPLTGEYTSAGGVAD